MWLTVSNVPLMSNYNSDIIVLCCHVIYIAFVTILIANSIDLAILLSICPSRRSSYSFAISERCLYIVVSMTLFIVLNKAIGLYVLGVCFAFYNLLGLAKIMTSVLCRRFGKYLYAKLVFVILAMMVVRGLSYIFRNPINR